MVFFIFGMAKFVDDILSYFMENRTIRLTAKEQRILQMIANGHTSPQIAEEMCLSLPTIKWYRKRIKVKFEADTTVEVVRKALEQGLI
jgi:two-component system NarL family response regulator